MLRMNPEYARMHEDRAERTIAWLVGNLGVKSFTTPKIETIDVLAADAAVADAGTRRVRAATGAARRAKSALPARSAKRVSAVRAAKRTDRERIREPEGV